MAAATKHSQSQRPVKACSKKPKRPLSAYNIYYKWERECLLAGGEKTVTVDDVRRLSQEHKNRPKRAHRKTHGRITFVELAREIGGRWKKLSPSCRKIFEDQALVEKQEYDTKIRQWKKEQKQFGEDASLEDSLSTSSLEDFEMSEEETGGPSLKKDPAGLVAPREPQGCIMMHPHHDHQKEQQDDDRPSAPRVDVNNLNKLRDSVDKAIANFACSCSYSSYHGSATTAARPVGEEQEEAPPATGGGGTPSCYFQRGQQGGGGRGGGSSSCCEHQSYAGSILLNSSTSNGGGGNSPPAVLAAAAAAPGGGGDNGDGVLMKHNSVMISLELLDMMQHQGFGCSEPLDADVLESLFD